MRRKKRGQRKATFLLRLLALVSTVPCVTPRPVTLVHQETEASTTTVRNKGPSAAAAASRKKTPRTTTSAFPSGTAVDSGGASAYLSAEIDASLFDQPLPLRDNAVALVGVQERPRKQQQQQPSTLVIAGTVDGQVHALDPATGDLRWSFGTGEPLVKSYQQVPGTLDEKKWLIPTLDGSLLVHTTQGLRRPGLKARLLVEQTPFLDPKGIFYTGSKVSKIFGVDARTGEVRQVLSGDTADSLESNRRLLARSGSVDDVIWIGRNDHTIRAFDVPTGQEEWNLTVGEFVSLDDLYVAASAGGDSRTRAAVSAATASAAAALSRPVPSLTATPDGSLQSMTAAATGAGEGGSRSGGSSEPDWNVPLPAHVASVFRVSLAEGSVHTYLPMQRMPLSQSTGVAAPAVGSGSGGTAAVGVLENGQVYAVALGEHGCSEGDDCITGGGGGGHGSRGKKGRAGEGKVTHGGRTTATQPLLPHGGEWQQQRDGGDSFESDGFGGGAHSGSGSLVQSWSTKGSPQNAAAAASSPPKWCQPGHSAFPSCLVGVHTVHHIGGEEQARLSLGMGSHAGSSALDGGGAGGAGHRDHKGVRTSSGYIGRLPPVSPQSGGLGPGGRGLMANMMDTLGIGGGGAIVGGNYLIPAPAPQGPFESLLGWLYRGWSFVSLLLLAVVVMVVFDSRRAAKFFKQVGFEGFPLYRRGEMVGEYDPTADSGVSGASEGSASGGAAGGGLASGGPPVVAGGVRGEVRVGCLTVSDTVLGYGSHGTVVYRGLLEGRPVAVKRMLTDFHARADREISLLIESDGHPNVVRYFVREEAGEFVYLALQLCQLSLHNAMAQIHSTLAQSRRRAEHEKGRSGAPRVGLGRALTAEDVSAPPELRAALLQVSQGVEHLHSLRIVHRDLKPHNILLAAKDRKGPGLGRSSARAQQAEDGEGGEKEGGDSALMAPRKLSNMHDLAMFVLKISDMGLGKQLLHGQSSFGMSSYGRAPGGRDQGHGACDAAARARASNAQASSSAGGHVGSIGWQAPEVIADRVSLEGGQGPSAAGGAGAESSLSAPRSESESDESASSWAMAGPSLSSSRRTQAVDVFSLGCIFHHCIVPGSHPFGQWYEREANIIQNKASHLSELEHVPDAYDLVSLMTGRDPDLRPSAAEVCKHPFFWNEEKRLSFLLEFSDRLEQDAVQSPLLVMVEAGADSVVGRSWDVRLDRELTEDAGRYRKYDFSSVRDLLRVVRNKRHHFHELPERVKGMMSPLPGGFLRYVEERFPQLLMHCTKVTGALLTEERIFKEYLVPFRRPEPPSTLSDTPAAQADTTVTAPAAALVTAAATTSAAERKPSVVPAAAALEKPLPPPDAAAPPVLVEATVPAARTAAGGEEGAEGTPGASTGVEANGGSDHPPSLAASANGGEGIASNDAAFVSPGKRSAKPNPRGGRKSYHAGGTEEGGGDGGVGGGAPVRVTEQDGPRGEGALQDVLVWNESGMAKSMGCRGWWRHQDHWQRRLDVTKQRPRGAHLNKALQDPKYRTRLCSHWENSKGTLCPMRRRGAGKCDFAHGGLELRVRANKRDRWGRQMPGSASADGGVGGASVNLDASGGEDTLGAARSIGRIRVENGEKDGAGVGGGGVGGGRQGKRNKGGGGGAAGGGVVQGATDRSGARDRDPKASGAPAGSSESVDPRSRSPRGGRQADGEVAREARPAAVVAKRDDWPPLSSSAKRPGGLLSRNQHEQERTSAADSGTSRDPRGDQAVRVANAGLGGGGFVEQGSPYPVDGSGGGRTPTRLASVVVTRLAEEAAGSERL